MDITMETYQAMLAGSKELAEFPGVQAGHGDIRDDHVRATAMGQHARLEDRCGDADLEAALGIKGVTE